MSLYVRSVRALVIGIVAIVTVAASAGAATALRLPVNGTIRGGGDFVGTVSINKFAARGNDIVATGFVSGTLTKANKPVGTAVVGEVTWIVSVRTGTSSAATGMIRPQAISCSVVHIALGAQTVNVLGFEVDLGAVNFDLGGESGTPLGDLVCSVSNLLGNVAGLVDVLNSLLGLVTGLLGGLGGIVPGA